MAFKAQVPVTAEEGEKTLEAEFCIEALNGGWLTTIVRCYAKAAVGQPVRSRSCKISVHTRLER